MTPFIKAFVDALPATGAVLDMGCGDMRVTKEMRALKPSLDFFGLDHQSQDQVEGIPFILRKLQSFEYEESNLVVGYLFKNVLQFLEPETVKAILARIPKGTIVAIETFYKDPDPAFKNPLKSTWKVEDFPGVECLLKEQADEEAVGLDGEKRLFFMTRVIYRA